MAEGTCLALLGVVLLPNEMEIPQPLPQLPFLLSAPLSLCVVLSRKVDCDVW